VPIGPAIPVNHVHLAITAAAAFAVALALVGIALGIRYWLKNRGNGWLRLPSSAPSPSLPTSVRSQVPTVDIVAEALRTPTSSSPEVPSSSPEVPSSSLLETHDQNASPQATLVEPSSTSAPSELSETQLVCQTVFLHSLFEPELTSIICDSPDLLLISQIIASLQVELWVALEIEKRAFADVHKFGMYLAKIQTKALLESETGKTGFYFVKLVHL